MENELNGLVEVADEAVRDDSQPIESVMDKPTDESAQGTSVPEKEPGWFQRRWEQKEKQLEARIRNEYESKFGSKFASMQEKIIEMDAKELVASGEIKDLEVAKELVRLRSGAPAAPQPHEEAGTVDPVIEARSRILGEQADKIKAKTGIDVMEVYDSDPDIKQKILNGDMDFYELAESLRETGSRPPAPSRSPNGARGSRNAIESMSSKEFAELEKKLEQGGRFSTR